MTKQSCAGQADTNRAHAHTHTHTHAHAPPPCAARPRWARPPTAWTTPPACSASSAPCWARRCTRASCSSCRWQVRLEKYQLIIRTNLKCMCLIFAAGALRLRLPRRHAGQGAVRGFCSSCRWPVSRMRYQVTHAALPTANLPFCAHGVAKWSADQAKRTFSVLHAPTRELCARPCAPQGGTQQRVLVKYGGRQAPRMGLGCLRINHLSSSTIHDHTITARERSWTFTSFGRWIGPVLIWPRALAPRSHTRHTFPPGRSFIHSFNSTIHHHILKWDPPPKKKKTQASS